MRGSRISNTVTTSVTLGAGGYASPLVVTDTGAILPPDGSAAAACTAQTAGVRLINRGEIIGGSGRYQAAPVGGDGVYFAAGGNVTNMGSISGGLGASLDGQTAASVDGGVGIDLVKAGGVLNYGMIVGGGGGGEISGSATYSATGGTGVYLQDGGRLSNHGTIFGGNGSSYGGTAGTGVHGLDARLVNAGLIEGGTVENNFTNGGIGVDLQGGSLANSGTIMGGPGSYDGDGYGFPAGAGGTGLEISAGGGVTNTGTIIGGSGSGSFRGEPSSGGVGVNIADHGTLINYALISGGASPTYAGEYGYGAKGGGGIYGAAASIANTGIIRAAAGENGAGDRTYNGHAGDGGNGIDLSGAGTIANHGSIYGGNGGIAATKTHYDIGIYGGKGGAAINFRSSGTLTNVGTISAGAGGETTFEAHLYFGQGLGGTGVDLQSGGMITNSGLITAGAGGFGHETTMGAAGGIGVDVATGGTLINSGTIVGGAGGGSDNEKGGNGGAGVYLNDGTLLNSGMITGGAGGTGATGNGTAGNAVQFGTLAATLVIEAGAAFNGQIVADVSADDRLELGGKAPGTVTGLGSAFTGLTTVQEDAGSTWTVVGGNTLTPAVALLLGGMFNVSGTLTNAGSTTVAMHAILDASANGNILLADVALAGGKLLGSSTATLSIGTQAGGIAGGIDVQSGAEIHGYGAIDADGVITDDGTIMAQGGTLTIGQPIAGGGSLAIDTGAIAITGGAVDVATVVFASGGGGTFDVDVPSRMNAEISGFSKADIIDLKNLAADKLSFMNGTLTLNNGGQVVDTLLFHGSYKTANFQLASDGHGGSEISFVTNGDLAHASWSDVRLGGISEHYAAGGSIDMPHFATWPTVEAPSLVLLSVGLHAG